MTPEVSVAPSPARIEPDVALHARQVRAAYESFLDRPHDEALGVRPVVLDSWRRSHVRGVDPDAHGVERVLAESELRALRAEHPLAAVVPVVRRLLVADAVETGLLVAITDEHGHMLWIEGDPTQRRRAAAMRFVEGADWSEAAAGTNAPGTALAVDRCVQIVRTEHYSRTVQPWSCSAAPVHDPRTGALLGVIDVTGGDRVAAPEMLSLVRATAAAAESELALLNLVGRRAAGPARLSVLGRNRPTLHTEHGSVQLSLRHAEILLLLAERPEGLRAEELAVELAEHDLDTVTVRAEVSRLRRVVGAELVASRPYRLTAPLVTEVGQVRELLALGDRTAAVAACRGPVLPRSEAPGVIAVREGLIADVRAALLREPQDAGLLTRWLETPQGRDDLGLWQTLLTAVPPSSPQGDHARARLSLAAPGLPLHARATNLQPRPQ